ncbi:hypothetical protein J2X90_002136 [Variovorax paradoxus]|uniref:hypothetical protein n=1 Tax=Variovorax paradoxus TaxID=34073 RepID=UPI00277FDB90|nr:hypothetical protein [Variovorax paradoxus]MDQ0024338.1 hypothetical protein [Variovorax paradoxus]
MAVQIISQDRFKGRTVESLCQQLLQSFDEVDQDRDQVYAVSTAGARCAEPHDVNSANLFRVISDLSSDALTNEMRLIVKELAARAGHDKAEVFRHG